MKQQKAYGVSVDITVLFVGRQVMWHIPNQLFVAKDE